MHSFLSQVFIITLIIAQICSRLLPDKVVFSDIWILCTHGFYFRIHSTNSILKKVLFDRPYSLASIWPSISYLEECHFPCEYPVGCDKDEVADSMGTVDETLLVEGAVWRHTMLNL